MSANNVRDLLKRSLLRIEELEARLQQQSQASAEPIAVIGMGCRLPGGATDPQAFWSCLRRGVDAIVEIPTTRWPTGFPSPVQPAARWAGLLAQIDEFDAEFFQISPREAISMDPQQRLLLEVAWEALEDAGQIPEKLAGSQTGVFIGLMNLDYKERFLIGDPALRDMYCFLGNGLSAAPGRLSYTFDFKGPCAAVDTACSSSLVAIHLACESLRRGECTLALAGGVHLILSPLMMEMMATTQGMSPDGRCKTFDARANGMVRAEGCGVVVLKRLVDAMRDGDPIAALIRGSAVNQDGRSAGFTVPNVLSQEALLRQALANACVESGQLGHLEAHGTGTPVGDPIEVDAIKRVLGPARQDGSVCALSSVKTNLGHLEAAAGVAGLIKTVLMLQHRQIPRHLNFRTLNPRISLTDTPLVIPVEERPWTTTGRPRVAGVSSFGVSGINAHAVLAEAPVCQPTAPAQPDQLLTLTAKTESALRALGQKYADFLAPLEHQPQPALADISYTASVKRTHHVHRLAVVGRSTSEWLTALRQFVRGETTPGLTCGHVETGSPRKLVFLFSGLGSQWHGMAQQLLAEEPVFRRALESCDAAIHREAGFSILHELTVSHEYLEPSRPELLQPVLFSLQTALAAQWRAFGVVPDAVLGTSMGEVAAAHFCGALSLPDAVRVICQRSRLIKKVWGKGAVAVVEMSAEEAQALTMEYPGRLSIAARNGPRSTLLSGEPQVIAAVLSRLAGEGVFCRPLPGGNAASHSPQVELLRDELLAALEGIQPNIPQLKMISTVTCQEIAPRMVDAGYWFRNMREPVLLWPAIEVLHAQDHRIFLEVSPNPVLLPALQDGLSQLSGDTLRLATLRRGQPERRCLLETLAELYARGRSVSFSSLHGENRQCVSLPTYPWMRERFWLDGPGPDALRSLGRGGGGTHELLGEPFSVSTQPMARFWERKLSLRQTSWLGEHRVRGQVIFPGAGYVEMALSAARQAYGSPELVLRQVRFERMLELHEEGEHTLQTVLLTQGPDVGNIQIACQDGTRWVRHAVGNVQPAAAGQVLPPPPAPPSTIQQRSREYYDKAQLYGEVAKNGGAYGPLFQTVAELWIGDDELLARLELPVSVAVPTTGYRLHPVVLDACFQVALHSPRLRGALWVPAGIEQLSVDAFAIPPAWVYARQESGATEHSAGYSLWALDDAGNALFHVGGLRLARLPDEPGEPAARAAELLYELKWRQQELPAAGAPLTKDARPWLLLFDRDGAALQLRDALQHLGERCITVTLGAEYERTASGEYKLDPAEPHGYRTLLRDALGAAGACKGILHAFSLDAAPPAQLTPERLAQDQRLGPLSALHLLQALSETGWRDHPPVWFLTRGAVPLAADPGWLSLSQATLWGFTQAIASERPELICRCIDLNGGEGSGGDKPLIAALIAELLANSSEDKVVLRSGKRYVARLQRSRFSLSPAVEHAPLRADGSYLVTGGLGGLGLVAAQWLAEAGARHLVLVGRSVPSEAARRVIDGMIAAGVDVVQAQADVASPAQLAALLGQLDGRLPPLRGIVHAASVVDDGLLTEQTAERLHRVLAAKAYGAWNLHLLTQQQPLDFFFCYSSAMSLLGSAGQSNYVAANAFLDALSRYRQLIGQPGTSINWGLFTEVGQATRQAGVAERLAGRGMQSLTLDEARPIFIRLLREPRAGIGVMRLDARRWVEFYPSLASSPLWAELRQEQEGSAAGRHSDAALWLARISAAKPGERGAMIEELLEQEIGRVLRLAAERVERHLPFRQMGIDSLMSLEIRNRLEVRMGVRLPAVILMTYPTIAELGVHLLDKLELSAPELASPQPVAFAAPADLEQLTEDELFARLKDEISQAKNGGK